MTSSAPSSRRSTLLLLTIGNDLQHYILWLLPRWRSSPSLLFRWSRTTAGANRIDRIRIGMPVFGKIWLKYQVALFARTLSTLLTGGLPPGALA